MVCLFILLSIHSFDDLMLMSEHPHVPQIDWENEIWSCITEAGDVAPGDVDAPFFLQCFF